MKLIKIFLLLASLALMVSAVTGTATRQDVAGTHIISITWFERLLELIASAAIVTFVWVLQKRLLLAWKIGFVLWVASYLVSIVLVTADLYRNAQIKDFSSIGLPASLWAVLGAAVTLYWALWWYQRKSYFH